MAVEVIFSDERVMILRGLMRVEGVSYPIAGITSASVRTNLPTFDTGGCLKTLAVVATIIFGVVAVGCAGAAFFGDEPIDRRPNLLLTALVLGALALRLGYFGFRAHTPPQATFDLVLRTAAGEVVALTSPDESYLRHLQHCIDYAVAT